MKKFLPIKKLFFFTFKKWRNMFFFINNNKSNNIIKFDQKFSENLPKKSY